MKPAKPASLLKKILVRTRGAGQGRVIGLNNPTPEEWARRIRSLAPAWMRESLLEPRDLVSIPTSEGPVILIVRRPPQGPFSHGGLLEDSEYGWFRDQGGALWSALKAHDSLLFDLELGDLETEQIRGLMVGLEMAAYRFKSETQDDKGGKSLPRLRLMEGKQKLGDEIEEAGLLGEAVNLARHLVNLPANVLNPKTWAELSRELFANDKKMQVEVWDEKKLRQENMHLHLAVGAGALHPPCLVCLKYRPGGRGKKSPLAFVGKGITFDTGGLDLKPSNAMRLMKKDMGGAAAILALAWWAAESEYPAPIDFYLALAENAVDAKSFRPGDVIKSRRGQTVEIHNTDAEGRLVLADALDVAVTRKEKPEAVINVATLTGAIKTALGTEISGLFSNHDELGEKLQRVGQKAGELTWRMPLYSRYTANFSSPFADLVNAVDGWGGPITAALFLEKFVQRTPWAHLDIYAWNDKASGALTSAGGNGQAVQTLIHFLLDREAGE